MIDSQALAAHYGALPGFVDRLLVRTRDALAPQVEQLRSAMARADVQALAYEAHTINGVGANLLLQDLREQAEAAEQAARAGDVAQALKLGEQLAQSVELLHLDLTRYLAVRPPSP